MTTIKLYRSIAVNEGDTIDIENIGCSWTLDYIFAEDHVKSIINARGKDGFIILCAEISVDNIDWSNTLFAMECRPQEFEVVVFGEVDAYVSDTNIESIELYDEYSGELGNNNFEDYNDNYEGELMKEDFFKLAAEF